MSYLKNYGWVNYSFSAEINKGYFIITYSILFFTMLFNAATAGTNPPEGIQKAPIPEIDADNSGNFKKILKDTIEQQKTNLSPKWYDRLGLRGYTQTRYNRLFETNPQLKCAQCDASWGENGGFFLRRVRLVFFGQVHEQVYFYVQPDFASEGSNFGQIRDAYFDVAFDQKQEFRVRIGQSKIPYGFENMQSSQNRLPLDRHDGLNSAVKNERDVGVLFYWAPAKVRERFRYLKAAGLKGSGDYGSLGLGLYNGQTANRPEANDQPHIVGRFTYPFKLRGGQIIEAAIQAYTGEFIIERSPEIQDGKVSYQEQRAAASLIVYPQPLGFQSEYNIGKGPEFNPATMDIETKNLHGGYAMTMYRIETDNNIFIPFFRWHYYEGGKKHEIDATRHRVNEQEIGVEWQPNRNFELVAMYTFSDRTSENYQNPDNRQRGSLLRLQAQVNY